MANPDFFKGLQAVLATTDLDTIKTYLRWQFINSIPEYALPKAMSEEDFNFNRHELLGQPEQEAALEAVRAGPPTARWARRWARSTLRQTSPPQTRPTRCRWSMTSKLPWASEIDAQAWMSDRNQSPGEAKLHMVADKIGYPDHWRDYSKLEVVRGDAARQCLDGRRILRTSASWQRSASRWIGASGSRLRRP